MTAILSSIMDFFKLGPKRFYREKIKYPFIVFVDSTLDIFRSKAMTGFQNTKDVLMKGIVVSFITSSLVWLSIFMYLTFYYTYVPSIAHERPVHLVFPPAKLQNGIHPYLEAHVELTKRQQLLMMGQPYKIELNLDLPESPANKEMGMFVVCVEFYSKNKYQGKEVMAQSCRSAMLHYRSPLFDIIYTVFYTPFLLMGALEEKQSLTIELFSNYEEQGPTVTDVHIEIQSNLIQVYGAKFLINAEFSGLRYFMFNWPLLSATIGILWNLFFIAMVFGISWYKLIHSEDYQKYIETKVSVLPSASEKEEKFGLDDSYSSSSIEDISILEKYRDKSSEESEEVIEEIKSGSTD